MIAGKISYMAIPAVPKLCNGIDLFILRACKHGGIEYTDLMSKSRLRNVCNVRHIIAYNLVNHFKLTLHKSGKTLGIDHATVYCAIKKYNSLMETDFEFRQLVNKIEQR